VPHILLEKIQKRHLFLEEFEDTTGGNQNPLIIQLSSPYFRVDFVAEMTEDTS
jgi:hypothetical protein